MLVSTAKRFRPADIGNNVVIPIERPNKMTSLGPRNMLAVATDVSEGWGDNPPPPVLGSFQNRGGEPPPPEPNVTNPVSDEYSNEIVRGS